MTHSVVLHKHRGTCGCLGIRFGSKAGHIDHPSERRVGFATRRRRDALRATPAPTESCQASALPSRMTLPALRGPGPSFFESRALGWYCLIFRLPRPVPRCAAVKSPDSHPCSRCVFAGRTGGQRPLHARVPLQKRRRRARRNGRAEELTLPHVTPDGMQLLQLLVFLHSLGHHLHA